MFHYMQATLCNIAFNEYKNSGTGRLVEYSTLPDILINDIIPNHFLGVALLGEKEVENIRYINTKYSKGFKAGSYREWESDSNSKVEAASKQVKEAAATFLQPLFESMLLASKKPIVK